MTSLHSPDNLSSPIVRFDAVTRRFGSIAAVDHISLNLNKGEIFCLVGPSGCGKTTLMRMLAGFEKPDSGRVLLEGRDVTDTPPHLRPVNMMFQSYALFPHLNVFDNVAFGLRQLARSAGRSAAQINERVRAMLDLVELERLGSRKPAELSGGQQQRVALARALACEPKVLLLDEPLAALDRKIRQQTQEELLRIQRKLRTTFLIVTHDQDEAMLMADRIGVMQAGRIEQVGTPREIYEKPSNRYVATFVGDVNVMDAVVRHIGDSGFRAEIASLDRHVLVNEKPDGLVVGQVITLAIRPEKVTVAPATADYQATNLWSGRVNETVYRGDASLYAISVGDNTVIKVSCPNTQRGSVDHLANGAAITVCLPADAFMVLTR